MKYFTPELYRRGNSDNDAEVEATEMEWHLAIQQYRKYLRKIESRTPPEVMRLASKICLHDGEVIGISKSSITVWLDETLYSIEFELDIDSPQPKHLPALTGHPFDTSGHCWLYDELEMLASGIFQFEILLSNGRILRFRFRDVIIWEVVSRNRTQGTGTSPTAAAPHPKLTLSKLKELVQASTRKAPLVANGKQGTKKSGLRRRNAGKAVEAKTTPGQKVAATSTRRVSNK